MTAWGDRTLDGVAELVDRIAAAVTRCPGVARLTQIPGMPVATYLPRRTVSGVAVRPAEVEICVVARYGPPLAEVAAQVRQAVEPLVPGRVAIDLAEVGNRGCDLLIEPIPRLLREPLSQHGVVFVDLRELRRHDLGDSPGGDLGDDPVRDGGPAPLSGHGQRG